MNKQITVEEFNMMVIELAIHYGILSVSERTIIDFANAIFTKGYMAGFEADKNTEIEIQKFFMQEKIVDFLIDEGMLDLSSETNKGWWETSTGVDYARKVIEQIQAFK